MYDFTFSNTSVFVGCFLYYVSPTIYRKLYCNTLIKVVKLPQNKTPKRNKKNALVYRNEKVEKGIGKVVFENIGPDQHLYIILLND